MLAFAWVLSIIGTVIIADRKNLNVFWFFFLSLLTGPIGLLIVAVSAPRSQHPSSLRPTEPLSVQEAQKQLQGIKTSLHLLIQRVERIESALQQNAETPSAHPRESQTHNQPLDVTELPATVTSAQSSQSEPAQESFEIVFGKYWLNRIGVVLFVVGIGLFINYTFHYFQAWVKIAIGYFFAGMFLWWGEKLQKQVRYQKLAWGILGGGWGLLYLVTYAMHYVPSTKIISNAYVELILLWLVTVLAIQFNLKYRSWIATAMCFLLGFITLCLGGLDFTSVFFWMMLIGALAYLSIVYAWEELLFSGVLGAYAVYFFFLKDKLPGSSWPMSLEDFQMLMGFLGSAWVIYTLALLVKQCKGRDGSGLLVHALWINTLGFAVLGLQNISQYHPSDMQFSFTFLLSLGVLHFVAAGGCRYFQKSFYIVAHSALGIMLCSYGLFLRYPQRSMIFWWMIQTALLWGLGIYYRQMIYRVMSWALGFVVLLHFFWVDLDLAQHYFWGSLKIEHDWLVTAVCSIVCLLMGVLSQRLNDRVWFNPEERTIYSYVFAGICAVVIGSYMWDESPARWLTLHWALLGISLLTGGFVLTYRALRLTGLGVLGVACARVFAYELAGFDTIYKIIVVLFLGAALLGVSFVYSKTSKVSNKEKS